VVGVETLHANREGRLTAEQAATLGRSARRSRLRRSVEFALCAIVAALATMLVFSFSRVTLVDILVPVAIAGIGAIVFRPWSDPLGADVRAGRVEVVFGAPSTPGYDILRGVLWSLLGGLANMYWTGRPGNRLVLIGPARFIVPDDRVSGIMTFTNVRAYYLPRSMTLLTTEAA
jgi:hypothetical protein